MTTKIEWVTNADGTKGETWNPITGCSPVSEGCTNCWAKRMARRLAGRYGYPEAPNEFDVTLHEDRLYQPLKWKKPRRIFVCSMGDLFHEDVSDNSILEVWRRMMATPRHTYLVLTKRPERMSSVVGRRFWIENYWGHKRLRACKVDSRVCGVSLPNVWLGVTAENQKRADERISILRQIPAAVRFVSVEPMLSAIDLSPWLVARCIDCGAEGTYGDDHKHSDGHLYPVLTSPFAPDWVILGGETGPGARPMHPDWVRGVRDQCQAAGVPFFFKSWGAWMPTERDHHWCQDYIVDGVANRWLTLEGEWCTDLGPQAMAPVARVGKKRAGRLLDGVEWSEFPDG